MRPSVLLSAAFAVGSMATPLFKRNWVTNYVVVTVTRVVTQNAEMSTAAATAVASVGSNSGVSTTANRNGYWSWRRSSSSSAASTTRTVISVVPTSVVQSTTRASVSVSSSASVYVPPVTSTRRSTTTTQQPSAASAAPAASGTDYQSLVLRHHDVHRSNNSASALTWNSTLADIASTIAAKCVYAHDTKTGGGGYGQNIAAGAPATEIAAIVSDWFHNGEVNAYWDGVNRNGGSPDMNTFEQWGHFSQIVWKGTRSVACATHYCGTGGLSGVGSGVSPYFTVCNYFPPGNYAGEYTNNVGASLNEPTVTGKDNA